MAETLDLSMFVQRREGTAHLDLAVEGVACANCIGRIEGGLKRLPGVVAARLNFTNRRLAVEWREDDARGGRRDRGARGDRLSGPSVPARARRNRRKRSTCAGW